VGRHPAKPFALTLIALFARLTMILSSVGLYSVLAYSVGSAQMSSQSASPWAPDAQ
jgi:hypothetical protein